MRLEGDQQGARRVYQQLVSKNPNNAIGYVFNLNTSLSNLAWDPNIKKTDQEVRDDANAVFNICETAISTNRYDHQAYYECGQAHLTISYLSAIRGHYYSAGRHSNLAIKHIERALSLDSTLVEAKMHLGVAYYYADNLPPFLKLLSSILWFIPQGNAEKSIPYLSDAAAIKGYRGDEAKYVYADILSRQGLPNVAKAAEIFRDLDKRYPSNERFGLLYISLLLEQKLYTETISAGRGFLQTNRDKVASAMTLLWITRAYMGLRENKLATETFSQIQDIENTDFPPWGKAWLLLTAGQLADLNGKRTSAVNHYISIIEINNAYVHPSILQTAENRLESLLQK